MKKKLYQSMTIIMILAIIISPVSIVLAADDPTSRKEEVIYSNLDVNGGLTGTYVVNILNSENGNILDYGNYSSIRNMTTSDSLKQSGDKITGTISGDRVYYEGILIDTQLPWNIKVKYYLDGNEKKATDIAGKSGALKISIDITENTKADPEFFESYTLQTVIKLDTDLCKNIAAVGATQANAGKIKQLTYTIMAGQEKKIELTANVTDFKMTPMNFNGIRSSIDVSPELFSRSEIKKGTGEIQNAVVNINDGAARLNNGSQNLNDSAESLLSGAEKIQEGLNILRDSSDPLVEGSTQMKKALQQLQDSLNRVTAAFEDVQKLSTASSDIKKGIDSLVNGLKTFNGSINSYNTTLSDNKVDVDTILRQNDGMISSLTDSLTVMKSDYQMMQNKGLGETEQATVLYDQIQSYSGIISLLTADKQIISGSSQLITALNGALDPEKGQLMTGAESLQNNYNTFDASIQQLVPSLNTLIANTSALKSGIDTLIVKYDDLNSGLIEYTDAVDQITDGYNRIYDGIISLTAGTASLYDATQELASGTQKLTDKTDSLDTDIQNKLDGMLDHLSGKKYPVKSFVSEKNTNIESVQFLIQTAAIEKAESEPIFKDPDEHLNFWQKLLRLFGLF